MTDPAAQVPGPAAVSASSRPRWRHSDALFAGAIIAVVLAGFGLLLSRIDLALLALPLTIAVVLNAERRPAPQDVATANLTLEDSSSAEMGYRIDVDAPPGVEAIVLRYTVLSGDPQEVVVAAQSAGDIVGRVPLLHSGPQELVRVEYRFLGSDASTLSQPQEPLIAERIIAPSHGAIGRLPLPRRLQGLTGSHESVRAGDGGDFRDIHPFAPGDRLRRIDWKVTARRAQNAGDLYVRRTAALADATVLIVLDSRDDIGEQVKEWSRNDASSKGISSLDVAREAASSIALSYIRAGDRVGFQDLSSRSRMIAHAGGNRHLWRLLRAIEITGPSSVPFRHQRPPIVPSGALVYLLSSLLDDQAVELALSWRGSGHRVIAVDVLPPAGFARTTRYERAAYRMVMMERDDRIRVLRERGVELLRWPEGDTPTRREVRLAVLSRPSRGAGTGRRR